MKKITYLLICLMTISLANATALDPAPLLSVAIVGDGVGGWPQDGEDDVHQMQTVNNVTWTYQNLPVTVGGIKFRGNNSWDQPYDWGGTEFPSGTAVQNIGGFLGEAGIYDVTFDSTTGAYSFVLDNSLFTVIGVIGTATLAGEDVDVDMSTLDGITYTSNSIKLVPGTLKFREAHAWTETTNWGGSAFPSGTGVVAGSAIEIPAAGTYNITFNRNTLEYTFWFSTVAIVGDVTESGWPEETPGFIDVHVLSTTDGVTYTMESIALTEGLFKFRADDSWARNWGGNVDPGAFPTGTSVQSGTNILVTSASTYSITLNVETGEYSFLDLLGTHDFNSSSFTASPNPTANSWNFHSPNQRIENIWITDVTGKIVMNVSPKNYDIAIDASLLSNGIYFAKVATASTSNTLKLIKK